MVARTQIVYVLPPIVVLILSIVLYIPEYVGVSLEITYSERITIILTVALAMFAAIEGYSTHMQTEFQKRRNLIDDARNELEKAYGPLYTLLNEYKLLDTIEHEFGKPQNFINLDAMKKMRVDSIIATYPFMFPSDIFELWKSKIQTMEPRLVTMGAGAPAPDSYDIPLEFRDRINEEYDQRVKEYYKLLGKEKQ